MSIAVPHSTQRMGEHLVLLVEGLKLEAGKATKIGLHQTTPSASNKITDLADIGSMAVCRICHDEDETSNMDTPCSCCGSLKFAHRKCVQMWCDAKGDIICEICRQQFKSGYKAPPPRFYYHGVGTNFRGAIEIPGSDMENARLLSTISRSNHEFLDDDLDLRAPSSTSFICCQIVTVIFTGLIVLRHTLPILVNSVDGDYSLTLFTIMAIKTIGILIPMYVVFKAFVSIKQLRYQQDARDSSLTSLNEENELPRWVHVL